MSRDPIDEAYELRFAVHRCAEALEHIASALGRILPAEAATDTDTTDTDTAATAFLCAVCGLKIENDHSIILTVSGRGQLAHARCLATAAYPPPRIHSAAARALKART